MTDQQDTLPTNTVQIDVNLLPGVDPFHALHTIEAMTGVIRVRQVFPLNEDEELVRMFVVDAAEDDVEIAMAQLSDNSLIEYVELVPKRRIVAA